MKPRLRAKYAKNGELILIDALTADCSDTAEQKTYRAQQQRERLIAQMVHNADNAQRMSQDRQQARIERRAAKKQRLVAERYYAKT